MRASPVTAMSAAQKRKMVEKGRALAATKPMAKGSRNWADGDGKLGEDVRDGALFLEYLHAARGDAHVEKAVGSAGDDAEYVGEDVIVRVADRGEEDEVERAAHEGGDAAAEAVGDGSGEGVADQAAEAQSGDDREHARRRRRCRRRGGCCPRGPRAPACTGP